MTWLLQRDNPRFKLMPHPMIPRQNPPRRSLQITFLPKLTHKQPSSHTMTSGSEAQAPAQTLRFDINTGNRLTNEHKRASSVQPFQKVWVTRLGGLIVSLRLNTKNLRVKERDIRQRKQTVLEKVQIWFSELT